LGEDHRRGWLEKYLAYGADRIAALTAAVLPVEDQMLAARRK
jgi:hypothetical protein